MNKLRKNQLGFGTVEIILVVVVVVLIGVVGWMLYRNRSSKSNTTNAHASTSSNSDFSSDSADEAVAPEAAAKVTVNRATRYTADLSEDTVESDKNKNVAVEVTIENPSSDSIGIYTPDFKLKDSQNQSYIASDISGSYADSSLPSGYNVLTAQTLDAKDSVKGTLEFTVPDTTIKSFTLLYNSQPYTVTIK